MIQHHSNPLRALIVEDSEDDALLLVVKLKDGGYEVVWHRVDTESDLAAALQQSWDIIFSDYSMPEFSGSRALKLVRETDPDTPFVFVSGTIGEENAVASIRAGAQDYVMKGHLGRLLPIVDREIRDANLRRGKRELENDRARLAEVLEATPDMVAMFDLQGRLNYLNKAGLRILGIDNEDSINGRSLKEIFPDEMADQLTLQAVPTVQKKGVWRGENVILGPDGQDIWLSQVVLAHNDANGEIEYFSIIFRDVSERKRHEEEIRYLALHNSLTGLPNRIFLTDRLQSALHRAQRQGSYIAVIFLNLDNFSRVNDSLGHAAGDVLLQQVSKRLLKCLRPDDTLAHHSGDEFSIVIGDFTQVESITGLLRKLREVFVQPIVVSAHEVFVTFCAGITFYPQDGNTVEDLLRHANTAMSIAKTTGPNQFLYYSPNMGTHGHEILALEADLQRALEQDEFQLFYQPQMDIASGRIVGVEGLIRWQHQQRGLVLPIEFVPLLERTGMIAQVGQWVLRNACQYYHVMLDAGFDLRISVNVSASQFNDQELLDKIRRILKEESMPRDRLELEITENIFMQDPENTAEILKALHDLGVRTAIDDFGTGYSSMAYLKRFPLNVLKIDKTFVKDLGRNYGDDAIIEASIILARKLGLEVIAEGVETNEQLRFLRRVDCNLAQGYYVSVPLSGKDLIAYLSDKLKT